MLALPRRGAGFSGSVITGTIEFLWDLGEERLDLTGEGSAVSKNENIQHIHRTLRSERESCLARRAAAVLLFVNIQTGIIFIFRL